MIQIVTMRLRSLLKRSRVDEELDEELRFHLDQQTQAFAARGLSPDDARHAALRAMGGVDQRKEECRDARGVSWLEHAARDLRLAVRVLRRSPGFTAVAIFSLALGIGANTAVFQLIDAIRLRTLPVARPYELMEVRPAGGHGGTGFNNDFNAELTNPLWEQIRDRQEAFSGMFAIGTDGFVVGRGAQTRFVGGLWASGDTFTVLGVVPARGRLFTAADDRRGCGPGGVVISDAFWRRYFAGQDSAIGSSLIVLGRPFQVIGVTPPDFFGLEIGRRFDVALPLCAAALWGNSLDERHVWWLRAMGRLKPGWTPAAASEHVRAISPGIFDATTPPGYEQASREQYRSFRLAAYGAATGVSRLRTTYQGSLWLLLGITSLVLLIACANLANLMLARASVREREIAVRVAIGASRSRIAAQFLTESLLLALSGAAIGAALANVLSRSLVSFLTTSRNPLQLDVPIDARAFAFSAVVGIVTTLLFGLVPALRASRCDPGATMKSGGRGLIAGGGRWSFQRVLVAAQVAASLVLLVGALLFVRSFRNLVTLETGFYRDGIVFTGLGDFSGPRAARGTSEAVLVRQAAILARIRAVPRIDAAAVTSQLPLTGSSWTQGVRIVGVEEARRRSSKFTYVSSDYFKTMGIGLVEGRDIDDRDMSTSPKVIVVNETFVRRFLAGVAPRGIRVRTIAEPNYPEAVYEIVGVVRDTKYANLRDENPPIAYAPITQHPNLRDLKGTVFHTSGPIADVIADVRRAVAEVDPNISVGFELFEDLIRERLTGERVMAWLAGFFGMLAAVLATIGLYGVISYIAARRRNEIGIRVALGASRPRVVTLMLRDTAVMLAIGLAIGAIVAVAAARAAAAMLFGLSPQDAPTLAIAITGLAVCALIASAIPAVRASRVDPTVALRCE